MKKQDIESAYNQCVKRYNEVMKRKDANEPTECDKVYSVLTANKKKIWWFAHELIGEFNIGGDRIFIGYKAPARLYDLWVDGLLDNRKCGRFKVWRLK